VRLLIDASGLGDDSAYRGIGTYVNHLIAGLACDSRVSVTALVRSETELPPGVTPARLKRVAPGRWRRAEHDLLLPFNLHRHEADVFHSPALDPPRHCEGPWVQTLHGLMPLLFADQELAAERRRMEHQLKRYRAADVVIAVSRHVAEQGMSKIGLSARQVEVIPHGVDVVFKPPAGPREADPPYLLMVAEYSPRKGYAEAFAVLGALAELGYAHRLHVAARLAPWVRPTVDALVAAAPLPGRIDLLGFRGSRGAGAPGAGEGVDMGDLVTQYQNASVLLVTSRYESFGLPILEAMACGTPVVAFANSAIPEVVGEAGILVADGDVEAMVAAVKQVLGEPARWQELSELGIDRARSFSWRRSVSAHVDAYRQLAS
jgi:glycosyltransferase involved in cell wall biosynthesis